jgi:hypothetical protein
MKPVKIYPKATPKDAPPSPPKPKGCAFGCIGCTKGAHKIATVKARDGEKVCLWSDGDITTPEQHVLGSILVPGAPPYSMWEGFSLVKLVPSNEIQAMTSEWRRARRMMATDLEARAEVLRRMPVHPSREARS